MRIGRPRRPTTKQPHSSPATGLEWDARCAVNEFRKFERNNWRRCGVGCYRHVSGSRITRDGKTWTANWVDGSQHHGYGTAKIAIESVKESDPLFWGFDRTSCSGVPTGGILIDVGRVDGSDAFVAYMSEKSDVLSYINAAFAKYSFGIASCVRCAQEMRELRFERRMFYRADRAYWIAVCNCGCPVWRHDAFQMLAGLREAKKAWDRRQRVKSAEGHYSESDILQLLREQQGRCCYCEKKFTASRTYTIDHVIPLSGGGSHWATNLLLACHKCNSLKSDMDVFAFLQLIKAGAHTCDLVLERLMKEIERRKEG